MSKATSANSGQESQARVSYSCQILRFFGHTTDTSLVKQTVLSSRKSIFIYIHFPVFSKTARSERLKRKPHSFCSKFRHENLFLLNYCFPPNPELGKPIVGCLWIHFSQRFPHWIKTWACQLLPNENPCIRLASTLKAVFWIQILA